MFFTCKILTFVFFSTAVFCVPRCVRAEEPKPQYESDDSIIATVTGRLSTVWDTGKLFYASVKAGGTSIEIDPADCPKITKELLDFINTQGGGFITDVQIVATGYMVFEKRPESARYRDLSREDSDAIVPVLRVQKIKITTLPLGANIAINRDRDAVTSTKVSITKR